MDMIETFKALSNPTRLQILMWLKDPEANFPEQGGHPGVPDDERHGKWTYFRRNEEAITELARFVGGEL